MWVKNLQGMYSLTCLFKFAKISKTKHLPTNNTAVKRGETSSF